MRIIFLLVSIILFFACNPNSKARSFKSKEVDLFRALASGNSVKITDNTYLTFTDNHIFLVSNEKSKGFLQLAEVKNTLSDSMDSLIILNPMEVKQMEFKDRGRFEIKEFQLKITSESSICVVSESENKGKRQNRVLKAIEGKTIERIRTVKNKEWVDFLGVNPRRALFDYLLHEAVFFENGYGMQILLSQNELYLMTPEETTNEYRTYVHLIREDGSFTNRSYTTERFNYQHELDLSGFNILRIPLENLEDFKKIRIGQLDGDQRAWAQLLVIDELFANPLLRHEWP